MARIETIEAIQDLKDLDCGLQTWYAAKDSDSVRVQRIRGFEMMRSSEIMRRLLYDVQPERRVRLTVGLTAIRGSDFQKREYDMYTEVPRTLGPGYELILERTENVNVREFRREPPHMELYVGDYVVLVGLSKVGKTLSEGGQLSIIEAPQRA
ncbi:MAG TPA: hypothetical protein VMQ52_02885 [Candidatus Saccharimonadales bacterium]|jgi:hypothetical protein|nr:hypothetical protein [Candidatus Saccharimonadales bacterium]